MTRHHVTPASPRPVRARGLVRAQQRATTAERPVLVTVPDVELVDAGHWEASTGPVDFTAEDLAAAMAALEDPQVRAPVIKLGHSDPRFNAAELAQRILDVATSVGVSAEVAQHIIDHLDLDYDATPAVGRVVNMRLSEDRLTLVGDFAGMPAWLADALPSAYPSRSIEGMFDWQSTTGRKHRFVITAVALLGDTLPAVGTLDDVRRLYVPQ